MSGRDGHLGSLLIGVAAVSSSWQYDRQALHAGERLRARHGVPAAGEASEHGVQLHARQVSLTCTRRAPILP